ncbi:hypothetical protein BKA56DRAFT_690595 [Ilyonectria sp. MPI-CAGE-AT-0026]|nr:hypothetical protein BKA56DRAFT_690595 [Ilyonectria sp. MPI-CAGE-AT-0026]
MQMLQDASRSRFHTGLLGLPGTDGRDIRRARDEARKKRQSGSNKRAASIGGTFIHPLIFASPTKYGPTGGGLGGIVGDSNAPSCLASAHRQTPYLGRAVGGPGARCRNDFTSWLPPDGRCIRASNFMAPRLGTYHIPLPVTGRSRPGRICVPSEPWRQNGDSADGQNCSTTEHRSKAKTRRTGPQRSPAGGDTALFSGDTTLRQTDRPPGRRGRRNAGLRWHARGEVVLVPFCLS